MEASRDPISGADRNSGEKIGTRAREKVVSEEGSSKGDSPRRSGNYFPVDDPRGNVGPGEGPAGSDVSGEGASRTELSEEDRAANRFSEEKTSRLDSLADDRSASSFFVDLERSSLSRSSWRSLESLKAKRVKLAISDDSAIVGARRKEKRTMGSLRTSLERKMGSVERMLEDHVERIWGENLEKHPWLAPIDTWIAERRGSLASGSYSLSEEASRTAGLEQRKARDAGEPPVARETVLVTVEDSWRTLSNDDEKNVEAQNSDVARRLREEDEKSRKEEEEGEKTLTTNQQSSDSPVGLEREPGVERRNATGDHEFDESEPENAVVSRESEKSEEARGFDFKFTPASGDKEEARIESRVTNRPRDPRRAGSPRLERSAFDLPASLMARIRRGDGSRAGSVEDVRCADSSIDPSVVSQAKEVKHHDLFDKLRDNVRGKMEDIHRYFQRTNRLADVNRRLKSQIWSSVVTIVLVEAKNLLPMDIDGLSDPYVKFRLGTEKYKSKVVNKTLNPVWLEQFDLHLYEDPYLGQELEVTVWDRDKSHQDDLMGRTTIDLATLERETTHRLWRELEDGSGDIFLLLTISGTTASETISDLAAHEDTPLETGTLLQRYSILNTLQRPRDVGHLTVKVYRAQGLAAADLGGKSDPFCVLELVNARLQTQTEYKTLAPNWQKIFTFNVKDINSVLEVTVYDEDRDHKVEFLGKVAIPLLRIRNGEKRWYALKDKKLRGRAKGNSPQILLEMTVLWNVVRACIRTLNPKEKKYMEPEVKFKRQVFLRNVLRLKAIIVIFIDMGKYIQSCWEWESKTRSVIALVLFVLGCYYFEPYMIPTAALLILLKYYLVAMVTGIPLSHQTISHLQDTGEIGSDDCPPTPGDDDDDEDDKDKEEKKSLKERLQAIQEVTQTVQNSIGYIASLCERVKNLFNFTVPYLSYLAMLLAVLAACVLYMIPVRYLILAWGVNKFSRKIFRPHSVPNNEILDLTSRVPDDEELLNYRELKPLPTADCERGGTSASAGTANPTRREQRKRHKAA